MQTVELILTKIGRNMVYTYRLLLHCYGSFDGTTGNSCFSNRNVVYTYVQSECSVALTVSEARRMRGVSAGTASVASDHAPPLPHADPFSVSHSEITFSMNVQSI